MKLTHASSKNFSHLLVATPRVRYTSSDFENYMPVQVKGDYDQIISDFIREHKGNHPNLHTEQQHVDLSVQSDRGGRFPCEEAASCVDQEMDETNTRGGWKLLPLAHSNPSNQLHSLGL